MKRHLLQSRWLALASTVAICLVVFGVVMVKRIHAFTLIEHQFAFDPVEVAVDQTAHVVFNNTFASQPVQLTINWGDAVTGAAIGSPFQATVMPGHGAVALLPAVQTPPTSVTGASQAIIVVVKLAAVPGAVALPILISQQFRASLEVVDNMTGHVSDSHGLIGLLLPAVQ
jgi:hypothetical protein